MRILVVTDNRFWREQIGSQRRISSLCRHLHTRGHELMAVFAGHLYPLDEDLLAQGRFPGRLEAFGRREEPVAGNGQRPALLPRIRRMLRQLVSHGRAVVSRWRHESSPGRKLAWALQLQEPKLDDFVDDRLLQKFAGSCAGHQPELIIIEYVRLAYVLDSCQAAIPNGCRTLIDTHDVQHERQERYHACGQVHDIDITPSEEARALSLADAVVAIQTSDAMKLASICPGLRVIVAGFPENTYRHGMRTDAEGVVRIAFFGSDMPPNRDAALILVTRIFPALRERFGNHVELHLYGKVCDGIVSYSNLPGVALHGFVDDLAAAYAQIDVVANPIAFGGGLKIKNVEALCHGRPLVTTSIGAEGIEIGIDEAFQVADQPASFVEKLSGLVESGSVRSHWSNNALRFAERYLSESAVYAELDRFIDAA